MCIIHNHLRGSFLYYECAFSCPAQLEFAFVYSSNYVVAERAAAEDGSTGWWRWLPEVTWTQVY